MSVAAIVAGGKAERLGGQPKGLIEVEGRRIVDRQLEALRAVFDRVFMVANDPVPWSDLGLSIVNDRIVGAGPLAGLDAALDALRPGEEDVVCVAGDMPFLDPRALELLRDHRPAQAVVPRVGGHLEPLFARYARTCAPHIFRAIVEGRWKTQALLAELDVAYLDEAVLRAIDPALRFLTNVNTPEDLALVAR
ncbi:MAG TPA: molybdenum cofactor guanylyltransferase [Polyangia bacterium]|nr:molybdenum cofactor guanylyltransferase [Polyangia bacterium]